jgi:hypothetical protein
MWHTYIFTEAYDILLQKFWRDGDPAWSGKASPRIVGRVLDTWSKSTKIDNVIRSRVAEINLQRLSESL